MDALFLNHIVAVLMNLFIHALYFKYFSVLYLVIFSTKNCYGHDKINLTRKYILFYFIFTIHVAGTFNSNII